MALVENTAVSLLEGDGDLDPLEGLDLSEPLDRPDRLDSEGLGDLDPLEGLDMTMESTGRIIVRQDDPRSQAGLAGCLSDDVVELLKGPLQAVGHATGAAKPEAEQRGPGYVGSVEVKPPGPAHQGGSPRLPAAATAAESPPTARAPVALPRVPGSGGRPGKLSKDEIIRQARQQAQDGTLNRNHQLISNHAKSEAEAARLAGYSEANIKMARDIVDKMPATQSHYELVARQARAELNR